MRDEIDERFELIEDRGDRAPRRLLDHRLLQPLPERAGHLGLAGGVLGEPEERRDLRVERLADHLPLGLQRLLQ